MTPWVNLGNIGILRTKENLMITKRFIALFAGLAVLGLSCTPKQFKPGYVYTANPDTDYYQLRSEMSKIPNNPSVQRTFLSISTPLWYAYAVGTVCTEAFKQEVATRGIETYATDWVNSNLHEGSEVDKQNGWDFTVTTVRYIHNNVCGYYDVRDY